jgi:hypothetical protein
LRAPRYDPGAGRVIVEARAGAPALAEETTLNRITQVKPGYTMLQVLGTLGPPTDIVGNVFWYKDLGKVEFEGTGSPLDTTKVIKVEQSTIQPAVK